MFVDVVDGCCLFALVLVWLVGGGCFSRLWCEASLCSLAWWWLVFVRLWFWRGWLVVGWRLLACGGPVFARWVGGWCQLALVQSLLQVS